MLAIALLFCVIGAFLFYYFTFAVFKPVLHFSENEFHEGILSRCPILSHSYAPTIWCFNKHLMLLVLLYKEYRSKDYQFDLVEQVRMKDGGITGLAWSGLQRSSPGTPVVVIFHTISGDEQDVKGVVSYVRHSLNWTAVVCIRRGHGGLPLLRPQINTMGSTSDLVHQLSIIQKRFPSAPLFGVGISAGSGLLARYLGESGRKSKFAAAVCVSPAYDIEKAFHRVHPFYSKIMGQRLINYFLKKHYDSLANVRGFDHAMKSKTIGEFQERIHAIAGFKTTDDYYKHSNPIKVVKNISTPLLILNSEDDPICVNLNVMENLHWLESLEHTMLVHTRRGSHIAYLEGIRGTSWSNRVMGEYFTAIEKYQKPTMNWNAKKKTVKGRDRIKKPGMKKRGQGRIAKPRRI